MNELLQAENCVLQSLRIDRLGNGHKAVTENQAENDNQSAPDPPVAIEKWSHGSLRGASRLRRYDMITRRSKVQLTQIIYRKI
jgi:hypothetical protein